MNPVCRTVRILAPSAGDGAFSERLDSHVNSCLRCQAELARYGKLRRRLAAMADDVATAPKPLAAAVAAAIAGGAQPAAVASAGSAGRIIATASALAAAAAGAIAVALWRHSRPAVR